MGGKVRSQSSSARRTAPVRPARRPSPPDRQRVARIVALLDESWGQATTGFDHDNAFQLRVAAMLGEHSADRRVGDRIARRVNQVTPALFARYRDANALARARTATLERIIRPTGFFRLKARNLRAMADALVSRHDGRVPRTMGELARLPGVTRETASAVLGNYFGIATGMVVDSHVRRVSQRLGFTEHSAAADVERALKALLPRARWIDLANELNWHGRHVCHAREPRCQECPLATECPSEVPAPDPYGLGWS